MTNSFMLFAIKCSVILFFAASPGIDQFIVSKSATPIITKGYWRMEFCSNSTAQKNPDMGLAGYKFVFAASGELKATKNGTVIRGNWSEDDISNRINIDLGKTDPILSRLNHYWNIQDVANKQVGLENPYHKMSDMGAELKLTAL